MQAYKNSFKPGDVMVVDSSNDFFRFMRGPDGGAAAAPTTSGASTGARKH